VSWLGAEEWEAVALSLKVAFWATILSLPVAIAVAYALARGRFWGHGLLNGLVHLPLVLPPVVTGYLLLVFFGSQGLGGRVLDAVGMPIAFRWTGAVLAAAVMAFPLVVRAIRLSIEAVDVRLEDAAATLGASPLRVFLTVTLPMAMPGVLAGTVLGFAKAMGEFGATITFVSSVQGETQTLSLAVYSFLQVPGGESAAVKLVIIAVALAMGALLLSEWLARRMARKVSGA